MKGGGAETAVARGHQNTKYGPEYQHNVIT